MTSDIYNTSPRPELISFDICPYVHRSAITLKHKNVEFDLTYIDLDNPPDWFRAISPLGKVPVLKHRGAALFESAVINEYLDEISSGDLMPNDPLEKARYRAWIEFASALTATMYTMSVARERTDYEFLKSSLIARIQYVEKTIPGGDFFNGRQFSLVDSAYAPLFLRLSIMSDAFNEHYLDNFPKLYAWSQYLCSLTPVLQSVPDALDKVWLRHLKDKEAFLTSVC